MNNFMLCEYWTLHPCTCTCVCIWLDFARNTMNETNQTQHLPYLSNIHKSNKCKWWDFDLIFSGGFQCSVNTIFAFLIDFVELQMPLLGTHIAREISKHEKRKKKKNKHNSKTVTNSVAIWSKHSLKSIFFFWGGDKTVILIVIAKLLVSYVYVILFCSVARKCLPRTRERKCLIAISFNNIVVAEIDETNRQKKIRHEISRQLLMQSNALLYDCKCDVQREKQIFFLLEIERKIAQQTDSKMNE